MPPSRENLNPTTCVICQPDEGEVLQLGPLKMRIMEDGRTVDNRISTVCITLPPKTRGPPQHWHEMHDETFLITKGAITFEMGEDSKTVGEGAYVVVPPRANHTFSNDGDVEAEMYCTCTPGYYVNYFRELRDMHKSGKKVEEADIYGAMARFATLPAK